MEQVTKAVKIAEVKYPTSQGYHHIWCFDHSCNHTAFAEDALIASKMNKGPGGKQPKMRDTVWNGQPQIMTLPDGRPKGAALILEERGYDTRRMKLEDIRAILADHDDFKNEKCRVDRFLSSVGHTCFYPQISLRAEPDRACVVPEQALHKGLLRLHHWLPSPKHSPGAEECFKGEHCQLRASLQKLHVCIPGGIGSWTGTG